ncbi:MAG: nitrous oxide reductase accessory protein NosL [Myxococcales bacterium]|nr:nitrous oxide reductase accessory protein NosL [Myxococcales bacterium]MCB9576980.1 nitrous oxide reductase accessory protein NosL [Polyangiaceae bacterium]
MKAPWILVPVLFLAIAPACQNNPAPSASGAASAVAIGDDECATCAMVVREQPSPRGQLVRSDGTRQMFCSIGDLLQGLNAPSAHGKASRVFVETLDPKADPAQTSTAQRPWKPADSASYVLGISRKGVMGTPVLAYATRAQAEVVAKGRNAKVYDWKGLTETLR